MIKFQPSVETDRSWAAADSAQTDRLASRQTQLTVVVYSDSKLDQKEEDSGFQILYNEKRSRKNGEKWREHILGIAEHA